MADRVQHTDSLSCASCEAKLEFVHEYLAEFFRDLKAQYPNVHVACGWRNQEDQTKAYLEGKSKAKFGQSKHNHTRNGRGYSLAIDLFTLSEDGEAVFSAAFGKRVSQLIEDNRFEIVCGINFKAIFDPLHFELRSEIISKRYKPI